MNRHVNAICLLSTLWFGCPEGDGDEPTDAGTNLSAPFRAFLEALPDAYCTWALACEYTSDHDSCVTDIAAEIDEVIDLYVGCSAARDFYANHRSEMDACLTPESGACGTNDDFDTFCPALVGFSDIDCTSADAGPDGGTSDGGTASLTTAQLVVGAWRVSGNCGDTAIEKGWFVCPGQRVRGYSKLGGYDFLDCGTWSTSGNELIAEVKSTAVLDPSVSGTDTWYFLYSSSNDTLTNEGSCPFVMQRLVGQITEADCNSGSCSAGGTGTVQCGTDCDCGRCWYCESGVCRYGGEGPYGCYRGCGY